MLLSLGKVQEGGGGVPPWVRPEGGEGGGSNAPSSPSYPLERIPVGGLGRLRRGFGADAATNLVVCAQERDQVPPPEGGWSTPWGAHICIWIIRALAQGCECSLRKFNDKKVFLIIIILRFFN